MDANVVLRITLLSLACVLVRGDDSANLALEGRPYKVNFTLSLKDILGSKVVESMVNKTYNGTDKWFYSDIFSTETDAYVQWQFGINYTASFWVFLFVRNLPSNIESISGVSNTGSLDANGKKVPYGRNSFNFSRDELFFSCSNMFYEKLPDNSDPQFKLYYDIEGVLRYEPNATVDDVSLEHHDDALKRDLVKRKKHYLASFKVSLYDIVGASLESMLNRTYSGTETFFKSGILATKLEPDVQWYFRVEYDKEVSKTVKIYFHLSSLPPDVEKVWARVRCCQANYEGRKPTWLNSSDRELLITGSYFKAHYKYKTFSDSDIFFDPKHRIHCDVLDASLVYKPVSLLEAKDVVLKTRDEIMETKDQVVKAKGEVLDAKVEVLKLKEDFVAMKDEVLKLKETVTKLEDKVRGNGPNER